MNESSKERYLREIRAKAGDAYIDPTTHPRNGVYAKVLHQTFSETIKLSEEEWLTFLNGQAADGSFVIPDKQSTQPKENQHLLALLAGQASGKTTLLKSLEYSELINEHSVQLDTLTCLEALIPNFKTREDRENKIAPVRGEILYLQRLVTEIALANGYSPVLDIHVVEESQAQSLADSAQKYSAPSLLLSPHIDLTVYAKRVAARTGSQGRTAFKDEHIIFHQAFAENFEKHFKHMFDMSLILDNNPETRDKTKTHLLPIVHQVLKAPDGSLQEETLMPKTYQSFKEKAALKPYEMIQQIGNLKTTYTDAGFLNRATKIYFEQVSKSLPDKFRATHQSAGAGEGRGSENFTKRTGRDRQPLSNAVLEKYLSAAEKGIGAYKL